MAGVVAVEALEAAWRQVVRRHEILRTHLYCPAGSQTALQVIVEDTSLPFEHHDLSGQTPGHQERRIAEIFADLASTPLDLTKGPSGQAVLVKLSPERHTLMIVLPALVADGASMSNVLREIGRAYDAELEGRVLDGEPLQYADLAEWQNELLDSPESLEGKKFWRRVPLRRALASTFPFEPPAKTAVEPRQEGVAIAVPPELRQGLRTLAERSGSELRRVLLTCWQVLLQRLTGSPELVAGVACDGRRFEELEDALGLFARYVPLHFTPRGNLPFSELLARTTAAMSELEEWQDYLDWGSVPELEESSGCLRFGASYERAVSPFTSGGVTFTAVRWHVCTERFQVEVSFNEIGETLSGELRYDASFIDRHMAERIAGWYQVLLAHACEAPETPVGELEILSREERRQALEDVNATAVELKAETTLLEFFERQVLSTPDRIALVLRDQYLTYAGLHQAASRLASYLAERGAGPEVRVGLAVERSADMVVAMLGIFRTGAAYIPLDPDYPKDRLAWMLADAKAELVITEERLLHVLPALDGRVVRLDQDARAIAAVRNEAPNLAEPAGLAYVIYTSGSTGRPKGVMVAHRAIANRLLWMQRVFPLGESDRVLQKTPYSFDASIWEIFVPLLAGATVALAEPGGHRDNAYLAEAIAEHRVTVLQLVPSQLEAFLDEPGVAESCHSLRRLFCGGEALPGRLGERGRQLLGVDLTNLYGPTESSIDASFHPCTEERYGSRVPIGRPLDNVRLYLLDGKGRAVPPGLEAELHIAGAGLARGYLGRPALTAERFVPDPFSRQSGGRLYRTGDVARLLPEGQFEFLGRNDHQVKLRGFRIELGEIEAVLAEHPQVREVVVVLRARSPESPEDRRIVAYVVVAGEPVVADLVAAVAERLPEHMVPSAVVPLDALPRLPNGKLDRGALPAPEAVQRGRRREVVAPRTATEEVLAKLWTEFLDLDRVGVHDNFFEAGGHSLLATQLVARIREIFGVEFRVRQLFEAPTVEGAARIVDMLFGGTIEKKVQRIVSVDRGGELPLSFAQQRLWFLQQIDPTSSAYHLPSTVELMGELRVEALEGALGELVRRHEILRTVFPDVDGRPVQTIQPAAKTCIPVVDLSALPPQARRPEARRQTALGVWRPFDLAAGPLLRTRLLRLDPGDHLAFLNLHHIVSDGWSGGILIREIVAFFEAFADGNPSPLPEPELQYVDYAVWQRQRLSEILEEELAYWRTQLDGDLPPLSLPIDRPKSAVRTSAVGGTSCFVEPVISQEVAALGLEEGCSLFMTLLAGFEILLFHYSGQPDLVVGSPVANRDLAEVEGLIGLLVNSLVLRTRWTGTPTVREFLAQVREVTMGALAHQEVPFETLVDELQPERSGQALPLFEVMFMVQNFPNEEVFELPGLQVTATSVPSERAKFDLLVELRETPRGIFCGLEYRAELFDAATVERMARHFGNVLGAMVAEPEQRIPELPVLTAGERHQLVAEWNDTETDYPRELTLQQLIEARVREQPEEVAVVFEGVEQTYGEVNRQANRLAHRLRSLGAGPSTLVAVYLERSAEMVTTLLGVLKAGAAYVPLDVTYPPARLHQLLSMLDIEHLITWGQGLATVEALPHLPRLRHRLRVDEKDVEGVDGAGVSDNPELLTTGEDLAYIIFTSGSTGTPKGVLVKHRPVVNLIHWLNRRFAIGAGDQLLFITSLSFDLSVYDVFGILAAGGTVRVASRREVEDPERLLDALYGEPITLWDSAPAALQQLVPLLPAGTEVPPSRLRSVFLSGDWIPLALPNQVQSAFPGARIIALGGATEATVWSNFFPVGEIDPYWVSIPYGRPIENARYHVLDGVLEPCAIGVEGDLYIGGDCLYSGYVRDARENALKNPPDPFAERSGSRLYRTGDRARLRPDGNIEFLGRVDHQVKIRGFRIELGEIEAALLAHRAVEEAVVVAREDVPGNKRLVAYVVGPGEEWNPGGLHRHMAETLPEYMIPSAFVALDRLPMTPNGKLDRRALPAPDGSRRVPAQPVAAPRNRAERLLAEIWSELLGRDEIGIHENFFELGGDSILSIQIVARARQSGLRLDPRDVFEHQTIAELVEVAGWVDAAGAEPPSVIGPAPLTPIQRWFLDGDPVAPHHFNQAVLMGVKEPLDSRILRGAVAEVLNHHDALRSRFTRGDDGWEQRVTAPGGEPPVSWIELGELPSEKRAAAIEKGAAALHASLVLEEGPLLRVGLFNLGPQEPQRLLITIHHLVVDGVSWRILLEDLFHAYRQLAAGDRPELGSKSTPYAEWARSLVEAARSGDFAGELPFWREQLRGSVPGIPIDRAGTVASARDAWRVLDAETTRTLLEEVVPTSRLQIREVLVTALVRTLAAWTGAPRVVLEIEGHGRVPLDPEQDLSRTVGWFTSIYPLAFDLGATPDPGAHLKSVKETLRSVPREGLGYGLLHHLDAGDGGALPPPPAGIVFNYLGRLDHAVSGESPLRPTEEELGPLADGRQARPHALEVSASIAGGLLHLAWRYSVHLHRAATVERLAAQCREEVESLIAFCRDAAAPVLTPSDFPLAGVDQEALDQVLAGQPSIEDLYRLSPLQEGLLFYGIESEIPGVYQQQVSCTLSGHLDVDAFERAWQRVIDRQAVLRTAFLWEELDRPLQVVHRSLETRVERLDWGGLTEAEQQSRLATFLEESQLRPLPLDRAPLMRQTLIRLADDEHVFVWVLHHLILDGWSVGRLIYEVFELYEAERRGGEPELPRPRPYRDYIAWLAAQDRSEAEAFWRRELAGFTSPVPLGRGAAGTGSETEGVYRESGIELSSASTAALREWARQHKLTLATLVEGAWAILLGLYSGRRDVLYGAVSAGRPTELPDIEEMVGLFITSLPVRARLHPDALLEAWLEELQRVRAEARRYEYCPLAEIQSWSEIPPGTPLFDSLVVFENYPVAELVQGQGAEDVEVRGTEFLTWNHYPLTLVALPGGDQLSIAASWNLGRLDEVGIGRLLGHLRTLLEGFPQGEGRRLGELEVMSRAERHQVLLEWARGPAAPQPLTLPGLFAEQALRQPDRVSVEAGEEALSYGELRRRATDLAHSLRALGVGSESRVGVLLPRSPRMVAGLLGVLEAGGAYLPLDPSYPAERLSFMVRNAGLDILLTGGGLARRFPDLPAARVLDLDEAWPSGEGPAGSAEDICADHLAYVLYTSGSTGQPKGVLVTHRGLANYLVWAMDTYGLDAETVAPVHSPLGFDLTVTSLFAPLIVGGRVHLLPEATEIETLAEALSGGAYDLIKLTPSHLEVLRHGSGSEVRPPRVLVIGGETLIGESLAQWRAFNPEIRLINEYGPTEATVGCSVWEVPPGVPKGGPIPIGRAIAGAHLHVLDSWLRPVPSGVAGELAIGGVGLARGYLGRPARTAERFVPDFFGAVAGQRLYRTGDLARYRPDGILEFLGRDDHQVKVRGYRMELGEIEAVLRQAPGVGEAVVGTREDEGSHRRLVAYVVASGARPSPEVLRAHLAERLPEYMVPSAFIFLAALPLTANGKVDRERLPELSEARLEPPKPAAAAAETESSQIAQKLAEIWAEVFGREVVGLEDNFFELGGDSILGLQIASRARRAGIRIASRQIFDHPTVAALATVAKAEASTPAAPSETAPRERESGDMPLTPIQRWYLDADPVDAHHFTQALLVDLVETPDAAALEKAARRVAEHHDAFRLRFVRGEEGWRQLYGEEGVGLPLTPVESAAVPAEDLLSSLDLARGPVARLGYFAGAEGEGGHLLLVAHHLVVDAFSWSILLEDLETAYRQLTRGEAGALPPRTASFKAWGERLKEHAATGLSAEERAYWARTASAEPPPFPVDGPDHDAGNVGEAEQVTASVDGELTRALLERGPMAFEAEINDLLLTALVEGLCSERGPRRLRVDLESHGRHEILKDIDISRTIGWFTTLFPVDLDLEGIHLRGVENARRAVLAVRERLRVVPSHGLGWGLLRYFPPGDPAVAREGRRSPILFNYLGQLGGASQSGGGLVRSVREAPGAVRSPRQERSHLVEINAVVAGGQLQMSWTFNPRAHRRETVERWVASFIAALGSLAQTASEAVADTASRTADGAAGAPATSPAARLSAGTPGPSMEPPPLKPVPRDGDLPLSFAEQRLWFLDHWDPGQATFNIPVALRLDGHLDVLALEQVLREVVRRHETLRTTFPTVDGRPLRRIAPCWTVRLPVVDLGGIADAAVVKHLADQEARRPFDLAQGPLMRLRLFRLSPIDHVLVSTVHHAVSDAWSAGILVSEVTALVADFAAGSPSSLPELTVQYADFAHWQRRWLKGEILAAQLAYWRRQLGGDLPVFELPTDRPRPEMRSTRGESFTTLFSKDLGDGIRALGRQHGATLFMTMLAAFKVLLYQRTRRDDIIVGTDVANRNHLETEGLIGFFVNQLALRTRLSGNPTFVELLERVREVTLGASAHQDLPFEQLVDDLGIERSLRYAPVFQIKFFVTNTPMGTLDSLNVGLTSFDVEPGTAQIDLTIAFREDRTGSLGGWINYSTELFDRSTIEELLEAFRDLLAQIVHRPDARLHELAEFLTQKERELRTMNKADWKARSLKRFKSVSPKKISAPQGELVKTSHFRPGEAPLVIEPALGEMDLADWTASQRSFVEEKLREHGALLFRGFGIDSVPSFERLASTLCDELFNENGEHPRESITGNVYTPVAYPHDQKLLMHNENSFNHHWPLKIMFCCLDPADQGGETPLVDSRKMYERLSPELVRRFEEAGIMYVRNYGEGGLGLTWRQVFQAESREEMEEISRRTRVELEWKGNGNLCTRAVRPAVVRHPATDEKVWFNQAQHWHVSCLNPETRVSMESLFEVDDLPRHCYLGDGRPIKDSEMEEILRAYDELEVSFPWQRGDVLVVDNLLMAHGRNPFTGNRKILVTLGDMKSFDDVVEGRVSDGATR